MNPTDTHFYVVTIAVVVIVGIIVGLGYVFKKMDGDE